MSAPCHYCGGEHATDYICDQMFGTHAAMAKAAKSKTPKTLAQELIGRLRLADSEMEYYGNSRWGNLCAEAADALEQAEKRIETAQQLLYAAKAREEEMDIRIAELEATIRKIAE